MGKITLYDDTAKINAAYLYAASGNYSQVARDTNIPRTTIVSWANGDCAVWVDSLVKARQEISDEILACNLKIVVATNEQVLDRIENGDHKLVKTKKAIKHDDGSLEVSEDYELKRVPMPGRDLAVVSGIKEDKARVALGQATSIVGKAESMESLAKVFRKISEDWNKLKVVKTQDTTEEIE